MHGQQNKKKYLFAFNVTNTIGILEGIESSSHVVDTQFGGVKLCCC